MYRENYTTTSQANSTKRRAKPPGQDLAAHLHPKEKENSFEDSGVHIPDREDKWFQNMFNEKNSIKQASNFYSCNAALTILWMVLKEIQSQIS